MRGGAEREAKQNKIVSKYMLRDERGVEAKRRREVFEVGETLQGLNWGNFFLFISISTGELNTR